MLFLAISIVFNISTVVWIFDNVSKNLIHSLFGLFDTGRGPG